MDIEDLKSVWKSVEPNIEIASHRNIPGRHLKEKADVKSKLLRRTYIGSAVTLLSLLLMATYRLWSPIYVPMAWGIAANVFIFVALLMELYHIHLIRNIDLWNATPTEVLSSVIRIKKYYRNIELWCSVMAIVVIGWVTFLPPFYGTWRMIWGWGLLALSLGAEYIWYRKNIRYLNSLRTLEND